MEYGRSINNALGAKITPESQRFSSEDDALSYLARVLVEAYLEQKKHATTHLTK